MADDNQFGYGQQHPSDSSNENNVDNFLIRQIIAGISTMKIVKVVAVDAAARTVDVTPLVKLVDGSGNVTDQGTIHGIKYWQPQWGKNAIFGAPAVDDIGPMVCADRDSSSALATMDVAAPGSSRKHSPSDGVYMGGIRSGNPDQSIEFTDDGIKITAKGGHTLTSTTAAGWTVDKLTVTGVLIAQNALQLSGPFQGVNGATYNQNIATTGDVTAGTISLKAHRTLGVTTGTGTSGLPTP